MPFPATLSPSTLDGLTGFRIVGEAAGDQLGFSVASAGDINGDGIADLIIGARGVDVSGATVRSAYVLFGRDIGTSGPFSSDVDLSGLDGVNGFEIRGLPSSGIGASFVSVSGAGDVNGDGIDDLIIGGRDAGLSGAYSGGAYIVFGRDTALVADFDPMLDVTDLDGANGFRLAGEAAYDRSGWSVASAGDVNGDGIGDLIIGALAADPGGASSGAAYVVFGRDTGAGGDFPANLNLGDLDGTNGFRVEGEATLDNAGCSVASAGDINGDGVGDLIVGARYADPNGTYSGASYVIFGRDTAVAGDFAASLALSGLNGLTGFKLSGGMANDISGWAVASLGDINGDDVDDLIVVSRGAPYGQGNGISYVLFGRNTATEGTFAADIDLSTLDGTEGFRIVGEAGGDNSGWSVASAGDINDDGANDLVIGAKGSSENGTGAGAAYVVFGRTASAGAFAAELDLGDLDGTNGFQLIGAGAQDEAGFSVAGAGDVNGDGIDDLIVGARYADAGGVNSGVSYVIFGRASPITFTGGPGDDVFSGGSLDDVLSGGDGRDTLHGLGGNDLISGDEGNDSLFGDDGDDVVDGQGGADKLYGGAGADSLEGGGGGDRLDGGDDADALTGGAGNDYLDGGLGADVMSGGTDNDIYIVDEVGDQTIELAGEGYDIVRTTLTWTLAANLEALQLQGAAVVDGTGNSESNNLQGNAGANTLSGLAGVDTINGNDGDDIIIGGVGNDLLRGGSGADTFRVAHAFGGVLETDQIYDFSTSDGDILDLSGAYAGTIVRVSAFTHTAGQMTLTFAGGVTTVRLDIDGNGTAEYQVKINGDVTPDYGGWML